MINLVDLSGKHFVVAGASSGIGAETARLITRLGGRVSLIARSEEKLKAVVESLEKQRGVYYTYDFSATDGIFELLERICGEQGKFDGAVYSVGTGSLSPLKLNKPDKVLTVTTVNHLSFMEFVRCVTLKKNRMDFMSIVGVSSIASQTGDKGQSVYCATKAAMNGAVRALAHELSPNIRINNVLPGWTKTEMYDSYKGTMGTKNLDKNFDVLQYMGLIDPIDVADSIAFLLSDASRFITGSSIVVGGGYLT